MPFTGAGKRFVGTVTSTDDMKIVSPIFTIPCGWNVRKRIGTEATSVHCVSRVSVVARSPTSDRVCCCAPVASAIPIMARKKPVLRISTIVHECSAGTSLTGVCERAHKQRSLPHAHALARPAGAGEAGRDPVPRHPLPLVSLAARLVKPLVLRRERRAGAVLPRMPDAMEHVHHAGTLSRLRAPVALDALS